MPVREEAFPFAGPPAVAGVALAVLGYPVWCGALLLVSLCVCAFFRDPERHPPPDGHLIVAPADGRILIARREGEHTKISIFMSVFNVHVNRAPSDSLVSASLYNPGKFLAAWNDKASLDNEQVRIQLRTEHGPVEVVLIAGLIARRIVCWAVKDRQFRRGERIGLIRFGSRVDLLLPPGEVELLVAPGERVRAGRTPVARWSVGR